MRRLTVSLLIGLLGTASAQTQSAQTQSVQTGENLPDGSVASVAAHPAAGLRLGAQVSGFISSLKTDSSAPIDYGVHASYGYGLPQSFVGAQISRVSLEYNRSFSSLGESLLLDNQLLWPAKDGRYWGVGFGTGFGGVGDTSDVPQTLISPILNANLQALYGLQLGDQVNGEAMVRLRSHGVSLALRLDTALPPR